MTTAWEYIKKYWQILVGFAIAIITVFAFRKKADPAEILENANESHEKEIDAIKKSEELLKNNSFYIGLITNIFNVKAFLFFVSLFAILMEDLNGIYFYLYPIYFSLTSALWFIFLSYVLTSSKSKNFNVYNNKYLLSIMSVVLCLIGLYVLIRAMNEYF